MEGLAGQWRFQSWRENRIRHEFQIWGSPAELYNGTANVVASGNDQQAVHLVISGPRRGLISITNRANGTATQSDTAGQIAGKRLVLKAHQLIECNMGPDARNQ